MIFEWPERQNNTRIKFISLELIKLNEAILSLSQKTDNPFDRSFNDHLSNNELALLCDPVAYRLVSRVPFCARIYQPSHASQYEGPLLPPSLSNQFVRGPSAVCRNDQAVKALAGFWLSDQALDRTVKGSALIKYNSTEAAVSSVNLDEQRMNWFGREAREREKEWKRGEV